MALVIPPGFGLLTFVYDVTGDPEEQTTAIGYSATDEADAAQLAARVTAWGNAWDVQLSTLYTLDRMVDRYNDGGTLTEQEFVSGNAGSQATSVLPSNCAAIVSKRSSQVGRQHQGRMFVPGVLQELEVDVNGAVSPALLAALQTAASSAFDDLNDTASTGITSLVIFHSDTIRNPALPPPATMPNPNANTPTVIGGLVVERIIGTQRRRMRP